MKKIFVTRKLLKENEDKLKELFDVKLNSNDKIYSAQEIIDGSKGYDGILSSVTDPISADTISKFSSSIKIIANGAVGFGNIDHKAARAKGISYFKDIAELNQKESPRLDWGSKILNMMGVKTELTKDSIKIYGQPNLKIKKLITIKNYLKDHRIFMMSAVGALTCGGKWKIYDKESINTSFPSFLTLIKKISKK